jgi:glycerol-3-phosphate acyltransferase PlsY
MDPLIVIAAAAAGYLLGSLSFARIVTSFAGPEKRVKERTEVYLEGSENPIILDTVSATSVSMVAGSKLGFLTYVLDMLKVFVPVLVLKKIFPGEPYHLVAAFAGVVGHVWPIYHKFKGGGGISAIFGGVFAIDWIGVFVTFFGGIFVGMAILRDVYLIYYSGLVLLIPWLWFRTKSVEVLVYAVLVNALFIVATLPSARRYYKLRKTDPKWADPEAMWGMWGMGRGIMKMMDKLGVRKKKGRPEAGQP